jgi:DNA mismatch repair protein MutL
MGNIIQLDESLSNLIAAGEVVENMASVVKELVENSIDAGSTDIRVDLLEAGLNEIKVIDNGSGMDETDMKLSVKRHATSKIKTRHDLFHIGSLGFRGEALPSIASVSHLELISTFEGRGYRLFFLKGELQEEGEHAPTPGTTVCVRYLFYNTPARLKHLKASNTELSYIVDVMQKIALSHPKIRFTLTNDGKTLLFTSGSGDVRQVLAQIYPLTIVKDMVPFEGKNGYFQIEGYLAKPMHHRSVRQHVSVLANQRMIRNNKIVAAVTEGFRTYLPLGKYPIVLLRITMDPLLLDVNIHPQKLEVKFTEERLLVQLITSTIQTTLRSLDLIPSAKAPVTDEPEHPSLDLRDEPSEPSTVRESFFDYLASLDRSKKRRSEDAQNDPSNQPDESQAPEPPAREVLPRLEYIGSFRGTYLLAQNEQGLYLIDQHAAAERIRYERYARQFGAVDITRQDLLIPITLDLSSTEVLALRDRLDEMEPLGLSAIPNDQHGIDITAVPTWFPAGYELIYAEAIARSLLEDTDISVGASRDALAKNLACKHSIKANQHLSDSEIRTLLADLSACENPFTCPHGRPTVIHFSVREVEKMFQRIQT